MQLEEHLKGGFSGFGFYTRLRLLLLFWLHHASGQVLNLVLSRYVDADCKTLDTGEGVQQSWVVAPLMNSVCYDVSVGMNCNFRCNLKLTCEYASGSGVMLEDYTGQNCEGTMNSRVPLASHLTWLGALDFFNGACTPTGDGQYMAFNKPVDKYPDCSAQGAVDIGEGANVAYESRYYMQFYTDNGCTDPYEVSSTSTFQFNKYQWRVYRGSQHCLDYVDASERASNFTASIIDSDVLNFKLMCGNLDGLGNGVMVRRHRGSVCSGISEDAEYWRDVFSPMNLYGLQDFFNGECVAWNNMFVKFDKAWNSLHYPDCSANACKSGYCSGGRLQQAYTGASPYVGEIRTPTAKAQALPSHAEAPCARMLLVLLAAFTAMQV